MPATSKPFNIDKRLVYEAYKAVKSLQDIARQLNPLLRGWIGYYGRYAPSALSPLLRYVNQTPVAWAQRKFKRFKGGATLAGQFIERLATERPDLFAHWRLGMTGTFV